MASIVPLIIMALSASAALQAQALQILSLSPQGEVAQVRQVVARFDGAVVNFGDPKAPAPLALSCSDAQAAKGAGRWTSDREWIFEFDKDLPPGVNCTVSPVSSFKSPSSAILASASSYKFNSGGPFIQNLRPGRYQPIDEEQYFVLELNGPATKDSLLDKVWCSVEGLGERVPVRLIDGPERDALLTSQNLDKAAAREPLRFGTLACNRRLTPAAKIQLVYGKGVSTPSGVVNSVEKRYDFTVREPFTASFSCERENAQSACLPVRAMRLSFNAPVTRRLAEGIRLKSASSEFKPSFDSSTGDGDSLVNDLSFKPLFPELGQFTLELPAGFKDASGRALLNPGSFPMKVATGAMPPLAKFAAAPFGILERFAEPGAQPGDPALLPKPLEASDLDYVQSRMVSLLGGQPGVKTLDLPQPAGKDPRPFEVIGIPLSPGFHVVEIASQQLGASLLDERHGASRTMYVRTSALVTNLGVHFKLGRDNALAWVTSLDKGAPVAGAVVRVSSC